MAKRKQQRRASSASRHRAGGGKEKLQTAKAKLPQAPTAVPPPESREAVTRIAERAPKSLKPSESSSSAPRTEAAPASFALSISATKLAVARFAVFAILALDAILAIPHAARYGAGFNLSHLPIVPSALAPDRVLFLYLQCAMACLCSLVAVGAGGRAVPIALTVLYGWVYFSSQLDSYQHHYLVWLLLLVWCFVPPPSSAPPPAGARPAIVRSSALRVALLLLGIVYLWAAISKMDAKWLDGTAMSMQIRGFVREVIDETIGIKIVSRLVIVTELALAVTIWRVRAWRWAWPLGVGMHGMIAFSGLEIGLFSYLMMALYLLVLPEPYASRLLAAAAARLPSGVRRAFGDGHRWLGIGAGLAGAALVWLLPAPLLNPLTVGFAIVWVVVAMRWQPLRVFTRTACASALLVPTFLAANAISQVSIDYYRYWAGSARRLGEPVEAEEAYRGLLKIDPELELGHFHLGRLLIRRGQLDAGLVHLRRAEDLEPTRVRALDEQVRALAAAGRADESRLAAERARARRAALHVEAMPGATAPAPGQGDGEKRDETDENVEAGVQDEPSR
jgi:Vitamin K-dependent gamma-carboxylase